MKKLFRSLPTRAILAAGILAADLAPAQTVWTNSSGNWSTAANWSPNTVPGPATSVLFNSNPGAATSAGTVDNIVDAGFGGAIASLQYANTNTSNGSGFYHTTQIASGQTLTITNGLTVGTLSDVGGNAVVNATIKGAGGELALSGPGLVVNQASTTSGTHFGLLNLTNLDTFVANVGRIQIGIANGVNRAEGILYLAKTNEITLSGAAPQLYMGFNNGNNDGSTEFPILYLGQSNSFAVDSITTSADKQGNPASRLLFNPVFTNNNPVAYFRGTNGASSRVSTWILGNNSGQTTTSSTSDSTNDFSFGTLDAMVDSMTVGISEKGAGATVGDGNGTFTFTAGTNNVNTLYLGYRLCTAGTSVGNGSMNVNGTATLVVNNAICLSFWSGGVINNAYSTANLNINGGTVLAATITNGVTVPGAVVNANLTINGGTLGITSLQGSIGTLAFPLGIVTLNNATLELPVSGVQTNLAASLLYANGTSNTIDITSVPASVITYPYQYPLISCPSLSGFNFVVGSLPGTYQGYISNNTVGGTIDLVLTNGPNSLLALKWNGNINGNWDITTANWLDGASPADYSDGANILFDDTATGATNINLTGAFSPTTITVNNNVLPYAFGGSGKITGTGGLIKSGAGSLLVTNSGVNNFLGNITINAGAVQFGAGATSGTLPPNGNVTDNGSLIFDRSDNLNVPNVISGPGVLAQNGPGVVTLTGSNSFSGTAVANAGTLLVNGVLSGILTNAAGSTIGGNGTNTGPVNIGGLIQPGAASPVPTTFTTADVNLLPGASLAFSLNGPDPTVGNGSNDLLNVIGNLSANNNTVSLDFTGVPQTSTPYTVINYSGSLSGSFNPAVTGTHYTATLDQSIPNVINVSISGSGANLKWDSATSGAWDLGVSTNWLNPGTGSLSVFYAGDTVLFDDSGVVTNIVIGPGVLVSPTAITNNSTHNYSIGGSGQINGPVSIVKQGSSTLALNTPNASFTGTLAIQAGTVALGNNAALGVDIGTPGPAAVTISSGGTLDLKGETVNSTPITVSGAGVGGNGAIINSGVDQIHAVRYVTLTGDTSLGGSAGRWDIRYSGANLGTLNGNGSTPFNLTKVGTNYLGLVDAAIDGSLGNVDVQSGVFSLELTTLADSPGWAGDTTHMITIESGALLNLNTLGTSTPLSRTIIMNGVSTIASGGGNALGGSVTLNGNATFDVSSDNLIDSGVISGPGNLILTGGGVLALQNANTYTGSTLLSLNGGSISLNDSASIATSTNITISTGSFIDVSPRADTTLTLASGQTLQGNGSVNGSLTVSPGAVLSPGTNFTSIGLLTVSNSANLSGTTWMKISALNGASDLLSATNGITYAGTLVVTNLSGIITNGQTFEFFSATNYSGAFTTLVLPSAPGLTWTNNLAFNGTLTAGVVSGPAPQPHITSISLSGTNLIINGTNGLAGEAFNVLTTTNLALPLASWTVLPTSTFSSGNFSLTNAVNPGAAQSFYLLRVP